jgi:CRP/FNR family transcriptional regulator
MQDAPAGPVELGAQCEWCGLGRICIQGRETLAGIQRTRVARGAALFHSGEQVASIYVLRSGCVKEVQWSAQSSATIMGFTLPGEMLGWAHAQGAPSRTTGIAIATSHVCAIPWRSLRQIGSDGRSAGGELLARLAEAHSAVRDLVTIIRDRNALQRVAGFLLDIAARLRSFGRTTGEFRLAMSRDDIASYLGLRSETVSRSFTELIRSGLIEASGKRVALLRPEELTRLANGTVK